MKLWPFAVELRSVDKRLANTRKRINLAAAGAMKGGDYDEATAWAEIGRSVADFSGRLNVFADEWKALVHAARLKGRPEKNVRPRSMARPALTPEWKLSLPALKALAGRGGTATLLELASDLSVSLGPELTEGDRKVIPARGAPRWHGTLSKSYRQCQKEGWIEKQKRREGLWKITPKGRAVAEETKSKASSATT
jgi:hypothetical protein